MSNHQAERAEQVERGRESVDSNINVLALEALDLQRANAKAWAPKEDSSRQEGSIEFNADGSLSVYDRKGRETSREDADGTKHEFKYNARGDVAEETITGPDGKTEKHEHKYDGLGHETRIEVTTSDGRHYTKVPDADVVDGYPTPNGNYNIWENGQLVGMEESDGTHHKYTYDKSGRMYDTVTDKDGKPVATLELDPNLPDPSEPGAILGMKTPDGKEYRFKYDENGEMTEYSVNTDKDRAPEAVWQKGEDGVWRAFDENGKNTLYIEGGGSFGVNVKEGRVFRTTDSEGRPGEMLPVPETEQRKHKLARR
jgi:YD repeat-containing protein